MSCTRWLATSVPSVMCWSSSLLVPKLTVLVAGSSVVQVMVAVFSVMFVAGLEGRWMLRALTRVRAKMSASVNVIFCFFFFM